jgi:MFS family permease
MLSILTYSLCSFASGLSRTVLMLAIFRFILGLGMGGEWNTGATLVAETWPMELRAKAISIVQSSWAIGYALAALVTGIVLHYSDWRTAFFVGILPALVTLWIRQQVPESEMWEQRRVQKTRMAVLPREGFLRIFQPPFLKHTFALFFMNFFGMFAWWGLFTWMPPYLSLPVEQGGRGFGVMGTTTLLVFLNLFGMFPGYALFGWIADHLGRRKSFLLFTFMAGILVPLYAQARQPWLLLILGGIIAFFGTGFFSGSGIIGSEIFPTAVRARALGFTYNGARALSSVAPFVIGRVGQIRGLSWAFYLCGASFLLACLVATQLPETKGKQLE